MTKKIKTIKSLPFKDRVAVIMEAEKDCIMDRENQGFNLGHKKKQVYSMGFWDAIKWITECNIYNDQNNQNTAQR